MYVSYATPSTHCTRTISCNQTLVKPAGSDSDKHEPCRSSTNTGKPGAPSALLERAAHLSLVMPLRHHKSIVQDACMCSPEAAIVLVVREATCDGVSAGLWLPGKTHTYSVCWSVGCSGAAVTQRRMACNVGGFRVCLEVVPSAAFDGPRTPLLSHMSR